MMADSRRTRLGTFDFCYCMLISLATILGTGILALPLRLDQSGFVPFMVLFSAALGAQAGLVGEWSAEVLHADGDHVILAG